MDAEPGSPGGQTQAQCPAHDDRNPSLSVREMDGQALLYCHAGCATRDVLAALDLSERDLFDKPHGADYVYEDGRVVHRSPTKQFRQSGNTRGEALYRLDRVRAAVAAGERVYVVEGEKDVHALESLGVTATCSPMGAGKAGRFDWSPLVGATAVVVVADQDEPGRKHADDVLTILRGLGVEATVVRPATGKDAADHVAAGHAVDEFVAVDPGVGYKVREELERLRIRREARELFDTETHAKTWQPPAGHGTLAEELRLPEEPEQWRLKGLLGVGHNAVLVASRKAGKTTMINSLVRACVDGAPFLGRFEVTPTDANVAIFNYEVDERQYRRWLRDAGIVHAERVHVLHLRGRSLPLRHDRVRAWVAQWLAERNVGLWVLDPYSRAYVGSLDNGNDEAQVGAFLDTLDVIKAESGVSELVIPVHTPKARAEAGEETAIGSQRLEGWPDALWYLTKDLTTGSRFLRAEGRDIEVEEQQLSFDPATRALTLGGGSRAEHRQHADAATVSAFVAEHHGCSARDICSGLGWGNDRVRRAVESSRDKVRVVEGKNRSRQHYPVDLLVEVSSAPGAPEHSGAPVQSGALHSIESTTRAPSTTEMEEQDPLGDIEDLLGGAA